MRETVLITGADKGLGLSLARVFLKRGFCVFAGQYGTSDALSQLADQFPDQFRAVRQDVTDLASVTESARQVGEKTDGLDILINNAGVHVVDSQRPLMELNLADGHLQAMMEVNGFGPLRVTQQFLPLLRKGRRKCIVNISSEAGSIGDCCRESWFGYCMSKAALNMESQLLQRFLKPEGFKVLAIHPGWMRTDMGGPKADLDPDVSAAAIFTLASKSWSVDDPVYMDYSGKPLNW